MGWLRWRGKWQPWFMKSPVKAGEFWEGSSDERTGTGWMAFSVCLRNRTDFGNVLWFFAPAAAKAYTAFGCPVCPCAVLWMAVFGICRLPWGLADGVLPGTLGRRACMGADGGKVAPTSVSGFMEVNFQDLPGNFEYFSKNF